MTLKGQNKELGVNFSLGDADLKKHVSINSREQIRQKREGISAS